LLHQNKAYTFVASLHKDKFLKTPLSNISSIQTGVFAKTSKAGDWVYLQSRHFDEAGNLQQELHPDLPAGSVNPKHLLQAGDVLFAAKGTKNFAAVYEAHNAEAVASTSFFVIRLHGGQVIPAYLAWFLNHPNTQQALKGQAIGSNIVSISKAVLENLEIAIPSITVQKTILQVHALRQHERALKQRIEELREVQIQSQLLNAIER
jgi:hypothetical protein